MEDFAYKIILGVMFLLPVLVIYRKVCDYRKGKKDSQVSSLLHDVFYNKEMIQAHTSEELRKNALLKIKAICDHLRVQTEISYGEITPSIDIIRSLSFMKEYLPEIEEQSKIYEENDYWKMRSISNAKWDYVTKKIKEISVSKWNRLDSEQKKKLIQIRSEEFDRNWEEAEKLDNEQKEN